MRLQRILAARVVGFCMLTLVLLSIDSCTPEASERDQSQELQHCSCTVNTHSMDTQSEDTCRPQDRQG